MLAGANYESQRLHSSLNGILRTQHRQVSNFNECYSIHCSCPLVKTVLSVIIRVCHCFAFTTVQWMLRLSGGGLICIFIDPRIVNEARVLSYIQAILRHEKIIFTRKKTFKYVILMIKDKF